MVMLWYMLVSFITLFSSTCCSAMREPRGFEPVSPRTKQSFLYEYVHDFDGQGLQDLFDNSHEKMKNLLAAQLAKRIMSLEFLEKWCDSTMRNEEERKDFFLERVVALLNQHNQKIELDDIKKDFKKRQPLNFINKKRVSKAPIRVVTPSDDKRYCAVERYDATVIMDLKKNKRIKKIEGSSVKNAALVRNQLIGSYNKINVSGCSRSEIFMSRTYLQMSTVPAGYSFSYDFNKNEYQICVNGGLGRITLRNNNSSDIIEEAQLSPFQACEVSADENFIVIGTMKGDVHFLTSDLKKVTTLMVSKHPVSALDLSVNNQILVIGDDQGFITLWDTWDNNCLATLAVSSATSISALGLSADNQMLAIGGWDGFMHTVDIRSLDHFMQLKMLIGKECIVSNPDYYKILGCMILAYGKQYPSNTAFSRKDNPRLKYLLQNLTKKEKKIIRAWRKKPDDNDFLVQYDKAILTIHPERLTRTKKKHKKHKKDRKKKDIKRE